MIRGDFDSNCENNSLFGVIVYAHAETGDANDDLDELMNN